MKSCNVSGLNQAFFVALMALQTTAWGAEESFGTKPAQGNLVVGPSKEGEMALKKFRLAPGLQAQLWAAEPNVANIVAFQIDDQGRAYVVETFRHSQGVTDIRSHMNWLDEELAAKSVEDREAILRKHEAAKLADYTRYSDRVRLVWDSDNDGVADQATVFSDGYNQIVDGLAAGVLSWRGSVYFANIPSLWKLKDNNKDGVADEKSAILSGFGVRTGFLGHDLHGLTIGPDGKLYFTIGDRGAHIVTRDGRTVSNPETGAFYRCRLDGTGLELLHTGLRNPQEIAFDDFGNWFTGDNNSDGGDLARWVALVEGGDSGWHIGYQFLEQPNARGPWIAEKMDRPQNGLQPSYILPPVANIASGPSGLAYYPGTGMPDRYQKHFFLVDFTGSDSSSVHSFALNPKGAGYDLVDRGTFITGLLVTDIAFGPDGGAYVSDWVQGWDKSGKGRLYRLNDPSRKSDPVVKEVQRLLGSDWSRMPVETLTGLLSHADQRVRLHAQFALVDLGAPGLKALKKIAPSKNAPLLARIHGLWGLGQCFELASRASDKKEIAALFLRGLKDPDAEIRAQSARQLGEARWKESAGLLSGLLQDASPRVRFISGLALARLGMPGAGPLFLKLAADNDKEQDPYIRHAAVMGLVALNDPAFLVAQAKHSSPEVRRVCLLALRRHRNDQVAVFLKDSQPDLVLEAARAISDLPLPSALPQLASLSSEPHESPALWRRILNAHYRLGTADSAKALSRIATETRFPSAARKEALDCLADWGKASGRDRVTGLWRPQTSKNSGDSLAAAGGALNGLLRDQETSIRLAAARLARQWKYTGAGDALLEIVSDTKATSALRRESLVALADLKGPQTARALELAASDADEGLRREATRLTGQAGGSSALKAVQTALERGSIGEQQAALAVLGGSKEPQADELLLAWTQKLLKGSLNPALHLDLLEAAGRRSSPALKAALQSFEATRQKEDSIGAYRECLEGGDAAAGKKIFFERADVACVRCHKVKGEGGEVGPELTGISSRKPADYILESIVAPNRQIAAGFETVLVTLKNGNAYAGQLKKETETELEINSPEDGLLKVKKSEISERQRGLSGMPEELRQILTKQDLRNLVEYLRKQP